MRRVALSTEQPCGIVGRLKRTRPRRLPLLLDMTFRIESEPLLFDGPPWSIQASALAVSVCCGPQSTIRLPIVQEAIAGVPSTLPAASIARTRKVCGPTARAEYDLGEVQAANAAESSEHSNVEGASDEENENDAFVSVVVSGGCAVIVVCGAIVSASASISHV